MFFLFLLLFLKLLLFSFDIAFSLFFTFTHLTLIQSFSNFTLPIWISPPLIILLFLLLFSSSYVFWFSSCTFTRPTSLSPPTSIPFSYFLLFLLPFISHQFSTAIPPPLIFFRSPFTRPTSIHPPFIFLHFLYNCSPPLMLSASLSSPFTLSTSLSNFPTLLNFYSFQYCFYFSYFYLSP